MESIVFKDLPTSEYPSGTYVILHHGKIPASGLVLSQIKIVPGLPNSVLESSRQDGGSPVWLNTVDMLSHSKYRPPFNMGVYVVEGKNCPAAIYGPLEAVHPAQALMFRQHLVSFPEEMQHLAHLF